MDVESLRSLKPELDMFLAQYLSVPEVRAVPRTLLDLRSWDEEDIVLLSNLRRKRNRVAAECHRRRCGARLRQRVAARRRQDRMAKQAL